MKKIINKRLEMISAFIEDNETVIDIYASICDYICISAGDINYRLILNPNDLFKTLENIISKDYLATQ